MTVQRICKKPELTSAAWNLQKAGDNMLIEFLWILITKNDSNEYTNV